MGATQADIASSKRLTYSRAVVTATGEAKQVERTRKLQAETAYQMASLQAQRSHVQKELLREQKIALANAPSSAVPVDVLKGSVVKQEGKKMQSQRGVARRALVEAELDRELQSIQ